MVIYILSGNYCFPNNRKIINIYDSPEKAEDARIAFEQDDEWCDCKVEIWQVN